MNWFNFHQWKTNTVGDWKYKYVSHIIIYLSIAQMNSVGQATHEFLVTLSLLYKACLSLDVVSSSVGNLVVITGLYPIQDSI